jgi:hypothetical protein
MSASYKRACVVWVILSAGVVLDAMHCVIE